jgi:hypothetical protein
VIFQRADDVLDVAGDAAEFAHTLPAGPGVGRIPLQGGERRRCARQGCGNLLGILGDLFATLRAEQDDGALPFEDRLGQAEDADRVVEEAHGHRKRATAQV